MAPFFKFLWRTEDEVLVKTQLSFHQLIDVKFISTLRWFFSISQADLPCHNFKVLSTFFFFCWQIWFILSNLINEFNWLVYNCQLIALRLRYHKSLQSRCLQLLPQQLRERQMLDDTSLNLTPQMHIRNTNALTKKKKCLPFVEINWLFCDKR